MTVFEAFYEAEKEATVRYLASQRSQIDFSIETTVSPQFACHNQHARFPIAFLIFL